MFVSVSYDDFFRAFIDSFNRLRLQNFRLQKLEWLTVILAI